LTSDRTKAIWDRAKNRLPAQPLGTGGPHSYHIIVTDKAGNIAAGTTTIESPPWGDGVFVEGVPLPVSGMIPWSTKPGERRLSPFSILFAFRDNQPRFAVGTISNSLVEAAFQLLVNLIDYNLPPAEAVSTPRFGTFPSSEGSESVSLQLDRNWLDPRIGKAMVKKLKDRGIKVTQTGIVDTGLGAVLSIGAQQKNEGVTVPLPYLDKPFDSHAGRAKSASGGPRR
jgi:gamma-glutamyltranspeptidase